tara:strand:- start:571 stop:1230 length:660 start_codon:yes stop_codon:yes gene_type:complete
MITHGHCKIAKIPVGIKGRAVRGRVKQAVLIKLPLNFNAIITNIAQKPNRYRLIIDIGAGTAISGDNAAYHQFFTVKIDILFGQNAKDWVAKRQGKGGCYAAFVAAMADKAAIGARTKCQSQRIKQNGFTGTCFPRQDAKPVVEIKIQLVDKDYIPNAETSKHFWVLMLLTGQQTGFAELIGELQSAQYRPTLQVLQMPSLDQKHAHGRWLSKMFENRA